jgi:hypothetical protein
MKTIAAVTFVRNAEKYILPHLAMYTGVKQYVFRMTGKPKDWIQYADEPDSSIELVRRHFPEVPIIDISSTEYDSEFINRARAMIEEDVMVFFHADVILSQRDWETIKDIIQTTDASVYKLDMTTDMINYYYDFDHGLRNCRDHDPVALSKARFTHKYWSDVEPNSEHLIQNKITAHHFCGWKGGTNSKEWIDGIIADENGDTSIKWREQYGEWIPCPQEIREMFI